MKSLQKSKRKKKDWISLKRKELHFEKMLILEGFIIKT